MKGHRAIGVASVLCVFFIVSVVGSVAEARDEGIAFTTEVVVGTGGGALLGLAGFWGATWVCLSTAADAGLGALGCVIVGVYGYLLGVPLGATLGVSISGMELGVEGDPVLAALGAILGEALGIGVLSVIYRGGGVTDEVTVAAALGLVPFLSAVGAAMGYNAGLSPDGIGLSNTFTTEARDRLVGLGLSGLAF